MDSILTSIKKLLGIAEEYKHFDTDIIIHINSALMTLTQLGVGPSEGFYIEDDSKTWIEFIPDPARLQAVKTYVYLKVRLVFDSASLGSATLAAYERQIQELEWRLNVAVESFAEVKEEPVIEENADAVIANCEKLNIRSRPDANASSVSVLFAGTKVKVKVSESTEDWYCVYTTTGIWGYCLKQYVEILE